MTGSSFNKTKLNFIIDAFLLLDFSAIIGLGLMIKYVLITGEQKKEFFGINFEQTFLGLNRHGWGNIHLYLGFILLGLLILHFVFHWSLIVAMFTKFFWNFGLKKVVAVGFLSICLFLIIAPLFIQPVNGEIEGKHINSERGQGAQYPGTLQIVTYNGKESFKSHSIKEGEREPDIRGYMSIAEVCANFNIPSEYFKKKIGIPATTPNNTSLSVLRKQRGIRMSEIENLIIEFKNQNRIN